MTVAVELATNAVKFTGSGQLDGLFAVEITCYRDVVRVAVADGGAPAGPRVLDDLVMSDHGRGLLMVRALAARVGICGDRYGRVVWADVAWASDAPAHRLAPDAYEMSPLSWRLPAVPAGAAKSG